MAQVRLEPPEPFNFRNPDDWQRWKRRFQQFREASGLSEQAVAKQVSTLLYCLGEEAEAVLSSTNATADDRKDYDTVLGKFDAFFQVRKNVRARFNRRNQQSGETAKQYIMALYDLAQYCDYKDMKEEMIRDRLVVGIRDSALSEKLQLNSELTLEIAKKKIRQREAVHEQQQSLTGADSASSPSSVDAIGNRQQQKTRGNPRRRNAGGHAHGKPKAGDKCGRCGRERHPREKCPAKDAQCHSCGRRSHYSAMCRNKTVSAMQEDDSDMTFLDTVFNNIESVWISELIIQVGHRCRGDSHIKGDLEGVRRT